MKSWRDLAFPTRIDVINLVLGPLVLWTYAQELPAARREGMSLDDLWAGIRGAARQATTVSIFVAAAAYLALLWVLRPDASPITLAGYALFLIGAACWAPMLRRRQTVATLAALTATSVGAALLLWRAWTWDKTPRYARWAAAYVFFHVFVLDNVHWGARFAS